MPRGEFSMLMRPGQYLKLAKAALPSVEQMRTSQPVIERCTSIHPFTIQHKEYVYIYIVLAGTLNKTCPAPNFTGNWSKKHTMIYNYYDIHRCVAVCWILVFCNVHALETQLAVVCMVSPVLTEYLQNTYRILTEWLMDCFVWRYQQARSCLKSTNKDSKDLCVNWTWLEPRWPVWEGHLCSMNQSRGALKIFFDCENGLLNKLVVLWSLHARTSHALWYHFVKFTKRVTLAGVPSVFSPQVSSVKNLHVREMYWDEIKLRPRKWNPRPRKRAEALAEADADRPIAEGPRKSIYSWRACCRGSSAEAESTYHSSAEAETVVAEAARKSARKTSRIRRELYRGFRHRSSHLRQLSIILKQSSNV